MAVGDELRLRAEQLCRESEHAGGESDDERGGRSVNRARRLAWHEAADDTRSMRCGRERHMYQHGDVSRTDDVDKDATCVADRHVAAYGELGLPGRPIEQARLLGHHGVLGRQGQRRRRVRVLAGCDDAAMWEAVYRNEPLLLRGCVNAR